MHSARLNATSVNQKRHPFLCSFVQKSFGFIRAADSISTKRKNNKSGRCFVWLRYFYFQSATITTECRLSKNKTKKPAHQSSKCEMRKCHPTAANWKLNPRKLVCMCAGFCADQTKQCTLYKYIAVLSLSPLQCSEHGVWNECLQNFNAFPQKPQSMIHWMLFEFFFCGERDGKVYQTV